MWLDYCTKCCRFSSRFNSLVYQRSLESPKPVCPTRVWPQAQWRPGLKSLTKLVRASWTIFGRAHRSVVVYFFFSKAAFQCLSCCWLNPGQGFARLWNRYKPSVIYYWSVSDVRTHNFMWLHLCGTAMKNTEWRSAKVLCATYNVKNEMTNDK